MPIDAALADEDYCYLTTRGRVSGRPREIEIWFGVADDTLYMLSGGGARSHWVQNLMRDPQVSVRIADQRHEGRARLVTDAAEDSRARALVFEKYSRRSAGDLQDWRRDALVVAVDL